MPTVIYKFPLSGNQTVISIPADAKPLKIAMQHNKPTMWVQLDPTAPTVERIFRAYGTGWTILDDAPTVYIDTYFDGPFVLHVFEVKSDHP